MVQPASLGATRADVAETMREDYYENMTPEEMETSFTSMWAGLSPVEQTRLRPHLTASNRGREIVPERKRGKSTSKAALSVKKTKKSVIKNNEKVVTKEETTTPTREAPAKKSKNARTAVLIPSTVEPQLEAKAASQLADEDVDVDDWVMLASETGEPVVNEDVLCTVSLSFVEVSSTIQPSVRSLTHATLRHDTTRHD
jgi:hypothetical protein